jgi:hypothetical protein
VLLENGEFRGLIWAIHLWRTRGSDRAPPGKAPTGGRSSVNRDSEYRESRGQEAQAFQNRETRYPDKGNNSIVGASCQHVDISSPSENRESRGRGVHTLWNSEVKTPTRGKVVVTGTLVTWTEGLARRPARRRRIGDRRIVDPVSEGFVHFSIANPETLIGGIPTEVYGCGHTRGGRVDQGLARRANAHRDSEDRES